ncbi:MAG: class I SAM-dependent methyltransferase [Gammaproteobacteria bacterium]|nr:class I SAM-dependent methyltransferase [Gammaproteobacteria bacterium]
MNLLPDKLPAETRQWLEGLRQDLLIEESLRGQPLRFHTTWGLFSPKAIDEGSRLLLDYIEIDPSHNSADLGCGYGPLGLTLARLAPQGRHTLLDKDFVAVEYSRRNARLNGLGNVEVILSNGFDQLDDRRFHRIVSNLPAKTGKEQYYLYFYEALARLEPGGRFYVVTINGLRDFIKRSFKEVFGNYAKLKQGRSYTVALGCKQEA